MNRNCTGRRIVRAWRFYRVPGCPCIEVTLDASALFIEDILIDAGWCVHWNCTGYRVIRLFWFYRLPDCVRVGTALVAGWCVDRDCIGYRVVSALKLHQLPGRL